ncbi:threonine/homoserine efflux transporter RhtA [Pantoea dispersa]|nr:threonine/homoserine efflux transporter RhtA [Pantoea dispersa]
MSAPLSHPKLAPVVLPVAVLLIAMLSLQGGASLAKSLFPTVGAPGITRAASGTGHAYPVRNFQTLASAL